MAYAAVSYIGKVCDKHPELQGYRNKFRRCPRCENIRRGSYQKEWKQNPAYQARQAEYRKQERSLALLAARSAAYKAAKDLRTPPWADREKIKEFYLKAAEQGLTVDHDIPLRGKLVSGLHVENNLVLLDGPSNFSKCNKFEIGDSNETK